MTGNFCQKKRRKDPVADLQKIHQPIMVKTDVKEGKMSAADRFAKRLKDKHGMDLDAKLKYYEDMKKKDATDICKTVRVRRKQLGGNAKLLYPALSKTVHKAKYDNAKKALVKLLDRKKKEGGGRLRHSPEYYAQQIQKRLVVWIRSIPEFLPKWLPKTFR